MPAAQRDSAAPPWRVGQVVAEDYEVLPASEGPEGRPVHAGGMGLVYRVRHRDWDLELAVKVPRPDLYAREEDRQRFELEAETWVRLGLHPHVVPCQYVRRIGGVPCVFADWVAGGSLADWMADRRLYQGSPQIALARVLDIAIQTAWGLDYAHQRRLVHQDVKPANIMVDQDERAQVTDFGLAQARVAVNEAPCDVPPGHSAVVPGVGLLTRAYASPEQLQGEPLTPGTDIWSWAVSVLELFCGERTWMVGAAAADALAVRSEGSGPVPLPLAVAEILRRCLASDPTDRPRSLAEVATMLQAVWQDECGKPHPRLAPRPTDLLADAWSNRAISLLDLGRDQEAEEAWDMALQADPQHPHATYNRGLQHWRAGRIPDDELVRRLEFVRASHPRAWVDEYLLALVHLERGDPTAALPLLEQAARAAPDRLEIGTLLDMTRAGAAQSLRCVVTLPGHSDLVRSVALAADGRLVLSGSNDRSVRLWDLDTGRCVRIMHDHSAPVLSVAMTSDGRYGLSSSSDKTARVWDLATGASLRTLPTDGPSRVAALTPGARLALVAAHPGSLQAWDLMTGTRRLAFRGHTADITSVALSADGNFVLSGSYDGTLRLWDVATATCLREIEDRKGRIRSVALTPDARLAVASDDENTVRSFDLASGTTLRTIETGTHWVGPVAVEADGRTVVTAGSDGTVRVWDLASGCCRRTFADPGAPVYALALTSDGRAAVSGGGHYYFVVGFKPDGSDILDGGGGTELRTWDLGERPPRSPRSYARPRTAPAVTAEAQAAARAQEQALELLGAGRHGQAAQVLRQMRIVGGWERNSDLLDMYRRVGRHGRRTVLAGAWPGRTLRGHTDWVFSVAITSDGRFALTGGREDHTARLWDLVTGACVRILAHDGDVTLVALSTDAGLAVSLGAARNLTVWEPRSGTALLRLTGHTDLVTAMALSPDGRFAATGSWDKTLRLWDVATGTCLRKLVADPLGADSVALSHDARVALAAGQTLRVWDMVSGACLRTLEEGRVRLFTVVALTPDARRGFTGEKDGRLRLWDLATGECLRTLTGHDGGVNAVAVTPDGRLGVSGGDDNIVRLWDLAAGECLRTFKSHTNLVMTVAVTADANLVVSGSGDGTLQLWELDWDYEFPDPKDWDEGASSYLQTFLALHTPFAAPDPGSAGGLTRKGPPQWTDNDFAALLRHLGDVGYGWLRPGGVRAELERLARDWDGVPPPLASRDVAQEAPTVRSGRRVARWLRHWRGKPSGEG
jgi:WD40 repeat protein